MVRLFSVFIPTTILGIIISELFLIAACYLIALVWRIERETLNLYLTADNGIARVAVVTISVIIGLYLNDCYVQVRVRSLIIFVQKLCLVIGVAFLIQATLSYGDLSLRMPRQSMIVGSGLCLVILPIWRLLYSTVAFRVLGAEKVVFVGTDELQAEVATHLAAHPEFAMKPVGVVVECGGDHTFVEGIPALGTIEDLPGCLKEADPFRVVVGVREANIEKNISVMMLLTQAGYRTESLSEMFELVFTRVPLAQFPYNPKHLNPPPSFAQRLQTLYSWFIAFAALIVLSPVLLLTALAVRLSSPGPILFRQVRTGKNNAEFVILKFRSMTVDAENETGAVWAQEQDPRVTPVGRILRKYRLDELPQLFNVLRNEMAIVGPRPERPEFVQMLAKEIPFYNYRHVVKPGITGWAQINYRYGNTVKDSATKLEYDLYYIKNFGYQLDSFIIFHTLKTMLLTRGAY